MDRDASPDFDKGQPGIAQAALFGLCPRCGARTVFAAPTRVADTCSACGLELGELEGGGRFVGLLTMVVALVLIGIAIAIEDAFRPNIWLQLAFWMPVTIGTVLGVLRLYKTVFLHAGYERRYNDKESDT